MSDIEERLRRGELAPESILRKRVAELEEALQEILESIRVRTTEGTQLLVAILDTANAALEKEPHD